MESKHCDESDTKSGTKVEASLAQSVQEGTTTHNQHGQFHRAVSSAQLHVISLGATIGGGVFIATGKALANAGALGSILAYALVSTCVFCVIQVLGEMTIIFPTSGNFIDYADRFIDPSLAFAAGFAEWLGWCAVLGSEAVFFSIIVRGWTDAVPEAAWLTIFVVGVLVLFAFPVKWFAWFQYFASVIKVVTLTLFLIIDFAIIMGAGPNGKFHDGSTWRDNSIFRNGFTGFSNACLLALWAYADQVFIGIMGGEAVSPRLSIGRAAKTVPVRCTTIFLLTLVFSSLLIAPTDPRLFGGSSLAQSPFVIALQDAGIPGLYQLVNVAVLVSVFGFGAESIYISSRILRALSHQGLIPDWFAKVDGRGRPVWSLLATGTVAVILTYMNLSSAGTGIFTWLVSITSSAFFMVWGVIAIASMRFHAAVKEQKDEVFSEIFAWKAWCYPLPSIWLLVCSIFLLICCIYTGIKPLGSESFSAENFFQYMLAVIIIIVFGVTHKVVTRSKIRRIHEIDLKSERRTLGEAEVAMLKQYYSRPAWRRGLAYLRLW